MNTVRDSTVLCDRVFLIDEGGRRKCPHGFMMCLNPICGMNLGECVEFGRDYIFFHESFVVLYEIQMSTEIE